MWIYCRMDTNKRGTLMISGKGCAAYIGIGGMKIEDEPRH